MSDIFCALCGVILSFETPNQWTKEFRAIYTQNDDWDGVRVSGVGFYRENRTTAPLDSEKRYDDQDLGPENSVDLVMQDISFQRFIKEYPPHMDLQPFWGFGFHCSCWTLLTEAIQPCLKDLLYACLSMPCRNGNILDWGHEYGGAVTPVMRRGLRTLLPQFEIEVTDLPIYFDPLELPLIHQVLNSGIVEKDDQARCGQITRVRSETIVAQKDHFDFGILPPEILQEILTLLHSKDVCSLRLVSRQFANLALTETFWASRFWPGQEYEYMIETRWSKPVSWKAMYHTVSTLQTNPNVVNRKRIWKLAFQLHKTLEQMGTPCYGYPIRSFFEPSGEIQKEFDWNTASRGLLQPEDSFNATSRSIWSRLLECPSNPKGIFVSLVCLSSGSFISGLRIQGSSNEEFRIGYIHPSQEISLQISFGLGISGWHLAIDETGIRGIATVMENGALCAWAGEYEGIPKRRLVGGSLGISTIKAEFDALKLVSLSIPRSPEQLQESSSLRDIALWSPDIPAEHFYFDGSRDNFHLRAYCRLPLPYSSVVFGGSNGQDLDQLVEIVGWVFDIYSITGIQFLYSDETKNKYFGRIGPFLESVEGENRSMAPSQDFRIPFSINGPGGEIISKIEVINTGGAIIALKIQTNIGREVIFPPPEETGFNDGWISINPTGSTVVGFYSIWSHGIKGIGLFSIDT